MFPSSSQATATTFSANALNITGNSTIDVNRLVTNAAAQVLTLSPGTVNLAGTLNITGGNGDSLTLIGPVELQTLDRGSATQLKRDIKSVVTGPRATLVVYQKQMLSARSVGFQPNTREAGLVEALGFGGRIESLKMSCS